ncbi:hypothetical protein HYPSUDRAFT_150365 [Hypholoma sublateritium FD-334 SS-4]|uniref:Lytic polysaccharide monooxygenase n=1 Tax=Hypholoma sublateritium (strain FD-334 SS-4) TaxID=945553 RepID=A0A0D2ND00_HYPSF|nr:hypothetical protein HYPSUDRAFT_150365 [Hypholoma sublateritium FD-334 SS-4]
MTRFILLATFLILEGHVSAHVGAWHKGMYCMRGNKAGDDDRNTNAAFQPMYNLTKAQWWFHAINDCDKFPPDAGNFLELPANGDFTVEHAVNRVFTNLVSDPVLGTYVDGQEHPGLGTTSDGKQPGSDSSTPVHTQNESMASGTAFAISYQSEIPDVTPENLVVFSVLYNTPWKRIAKYSVPDLPPCPAAGCICAFGWIPNGCGEPTLYMQGFRCTVTGSKTNPVRTIKYPAVAPQWCQDNSAQCVTGPKQMIYWQQAEGNNVVVSGNDKYGFPKFPVYNMNMGFPNGTLTMYALGDSRTLLTGDYDIRRPNNNILELAPIGIHLATPFHLRCTRQYVFYKPSISPNMRSKTTNAGHCTASVYSRNSAELSSLSSIRLSASNIKCVPCHRQ